ncbi:MAG: hypothetical protein MI746_16580, partial [Pseudomonadales bacterium]|nr:hypothetical protein [Pseudomonadales bacterium]
QRELAIFGGILEDSMRLNDSTGLFGMSLGGVEATYLYGQGAVLEIRSALANRRNRMGLASLSSAMQALQIRQNPFEAMRRDSASTSPQVASLAAAEDSLATGYRQLLDRIANIDYSLVAQSAMQQAAQSARALRALGDVDDSSYAALEQELASLRDRVDENVQALRSLEQEIRTSRASETAPNNANSDFSAQLDSLVQAFEPVKDMALAKAAELRARSEQAEQDYALAWQQDLENFRLQLYESVCEYGSTLRSIPSDENLSIVLKGLGEDQGDNRRSDEVHVMSNRDIRDCGNQEIDAATLRERSLAYTF